MSNKLLNELRQVLNFAQHENHQLKCQLIRQEVEADKRVVSQSAKHLKLEVYHQSTRGDHCRFLEIYVS